MEPNLFGRKLGIGVRVASRMAKERAVEASRHAEQASRSAAETVREKAPVHAEKARAVAAGTKRFGQAFLGPLGHATGVLWLEITGVFFALFALFFAQNLYRIRAQYSAGPQHRLFLLYAAGSAVFFYFSLSSFLRARRKENRNKEKSQR
jgi:hypothetical protein